MLAIAYGVDKIAPYIGSRLIILTDHKAWVQLQNMQCANRRVDKWRQIIAQLPQLPGYPKFIFRKGTEQKDVDPLSRTSHVPLPNEESIDTYITEKVEDPMILPGVYKLTLGWEPYDSITAWLKYGGLPKHATADEQAAIKRRALDYFISGDELYRRPRPGGIPRRVPTLEEIPILLADYHGDKSAYGHQQLHSTYQFLSLRYYWKNMYEHVQNHIESCEACAAKKKKNSHRFELYRMTPPPSLFMLLGIDTVAMPVGKNGKNSFISIIDYNSKYALANPCKSPDGSVVIKIVKQWCHRFSYPKWIRVDNGSYYCSGVFPEWCKQNGIALLPTSSMHPQAQGQVENVNKQFPMLLARRLISQDLPIAAWPDVMSDVNLDYNTHIAETTGVSPFAVVYGQLPNMPSNNRENFPDYTLEELQQLRTSTDATVDIIRKSALENLKEHQETRAVHQSRIPPRTYVPGDWVWCYKSELDSQYITSRKIIERWDGPLRVTNAFPGGTYRLVDEHGVQYRKGLSISHQRLAPVTKAKSLLDIAASVPKATQE
jgi:transposase InsO family protein